MEQQTLTVTVTVPKGTTRKEARGVLQMLLNAEQDAPTVTATVENFVVLTMPLTDDQCCDTMDDDGYVEGVIAVDLGDLIDHDLEGVLDLMSERLCDPVLGDINYNVVGHDGEGTLYVKVSGNVAEYLGEQWEVLVVVKGNAMELTDNLDLLAKVAGREADEVTNGADGSANVLYRVSGDDVQELNDKIEAAKLPFVVNIIMTSDADDDN